MFAIIVILGICAVAFGIAVTQAVVDALEAYERNVQRRLSKKPSKGVCL